jgi:hypothetical protein
MAMAVPSEKRRHSIVYRQWQYLAKRCGMGDRLDPLIGELKAATPAVIAKVESLLPKEFPASVADIQGPPRLDATTGSLATAISLRSACLASFLPRHRQSLPQLIDKDPLIFRVIDRHRDEMYAAADERIL